MSYFIDCNCGPGSIDDNCDYAGKCSCKYGFDGHKCDTCSKGFHGFPNCERDPVLLGKIESVLSSTS